MPCMNYLIECCTELKPAHADALADSWVKMRIKFGDSTSSEESRKGKKTITNSCAVCGKEEFENDNDDVTIVKCGICTKLHSHESGPKPPYFTQKYKR